MLDTLLHPQLILYSSRYGPLPLNCLAGFHSPDRAGGSWHSDTHEHPAICLRIMRLITSNAGWDAGRVVVTGVEQEKP